MMFPLLTIRYSRNKICGPGAVMTRRGTAYANY